MERPGAALHHQAGLEADQGVPADLPALEVQEGRGVLEAQEVGTSALLNCALRLIFMYRRHIFRTFHIAVDFYIVLYEGTM